MTRIKVNFGKIKTRIVNPLTSASGELRNASEAFEKLRVPSGFKYESYVKSLASTISGIASDVTSISNNVDTYYDNFIKFNNESTEMLTNINKFEMSTRINGVNRIRG